MELFELATDAFKRGDITEMIRRIEDVCTASLENRSSCSTLLCSAAISALQNERVPLALELLERALALNMYDTQALELLMMLHKHGIHSPVLHSEFGLFEPSRIMSVEDYLLRYPDQGKKVILRSSPVDATEIRAGLSLYRLFRIAITGFAKIPRTLGQGMLLLGIKGEILKESIDGREISHVITQVLKIRSRPQYFLKRKGSFVMLCSFRATYQSNWFERELPRVQILEKEGFGGIYLIPSEGSPYRNSLCNLGISDDRIEVYDGTEYMLEELYFTLNEIDTL